MQKLPCKQQKYNPQKYIFFPQVFLLFPSPSEDLDYKVHNWISALGLVFIQSEISTVVCIVELITFVTIIAN